MRLLATLAKAWLIVLFVVLLGYLAIYDQEHVSLHLPPWIEHITLPAYAMYMGFFLLGMVASGLFFGVSSLRKSFEIRRLNKRLKELEPQEPDHPEPVSSVTGRAFSRGPEL